MNDDLISLDLALSKIGLDEYYHSNEVKGILHNIPAIDAVSVEHGRWIPESNYYDDDTWVCSECGDKWSFCKGNPKDIGMNYCPNCGARMDGGAT